MKSIFKVVRSLFQQSNSTLDHWRRARSVWSASETVQIGNTGVRPKIGRCAQALLNVIIVPSAESQLQASLNDTDPRIVAYSLAGLEMLDSAALESLPNELLTRTESVRLLTGNTLLEIPLNTFVSEVSKRRTEGRSLERWLSYGRRVLPESLPGYLAQLRSLATDSPPATPRC